MCRRGCMVNVVISRHSIEQPFGSAARSRDAFLPVDGTRWFLSKWSLLTHWARVTHIFVSKLTIIGSDNGLSPGRHKAIIWTNAGILLIWNLGANFSEILIEMYTFPLKKMHLKMSSAEWWQFCIGLIIKMKYYTLRLYLHAIQAFMAAMLAYIKPYCKTNTT